MIGRNLAVSHKATVAPGLQGWPFGLVGSASGQVSRAGGRFGGGYMRTWSFFPGPQYPQRSPGPFRSL